MPADATGLEGQPLPRLAAFLMPAIASAFRSQRPWQAPFRSTRHARRCLIAVYVLMIATAAFDITFQLAGNPSTGRFAEAGSAIVVALLALKIVEPGGTWAKVSRNYLAFAVATRSLGAVIALADGSLAPATGGAVLTGMYAVLTFAAMRAMAAHACLAAARADVALPSATP